ncbi:MAG: YitT family protein [Bacteroides sp.]|nr:YitT family protein [Bacteroides sp.]MCM1378865.1 YitT family protein [Bacteroides sp.]MCM1445481.1 YitT family protein [Prevotella sp.]
MPKFSKLTWLDLKDYLFIVLGLTLYSFGFSAFILPHKIVMGGMAGLGSVVYFLTLRLHESGMFPFVIPVAVTMYAVNFLLLAIAFRIVDRQFTIRTLFGMTVLSVVIGIMQPLCANLNIMPDEKVLSIVLGACIMGVGLGTIFIHNGSSGGTDIIAAMVSKRSNVTIGRTMMACDFLIVGSAYFVLHYPLPEIVFGMMTTVLTGYMCDLVINSNRQAVEFIIISKHWEAIANAINTDANRGCTVLDGMGWYSKQPVKMLMVMCRKIEAVTIQRIVKSIDPEALVTQGNVNGVYGKGFDKMKVNINKKPVKIINPDHLE